MGTFRNIRFLLIVIIAALSGKTICSQEKADSLTDLLLTAKSDTQRVDYLLEYAKKYSWSDVDLAEKYTKEALNLSQKINYQKGLGYAKFQLSRIIGDYDFELSESLVVQALDHAKKIDDSILMANAYCSLGNLKGNFDFNEEALDYFNRSLGIFLRHNQDSSAAVLYNNLGVLFDMMYPDSVPNHYYELATEINLRTKNYLWLAITYLNKGVDLYESDEFTQSKVYLDKSYQLILDNDNTRLLPWILNSYSELYNRQGDLKLAIRFADSSLVHARKESNSLQELSALQKLNKANLKLGNIQAAYNYLEQYLTVNDSINAKNRLKGYDVLELKYKFEEEAKQQELEKALLKNKLFQSRITILSIVLTAGLIIFLLLFVYISLRNRMKNKTLEQKNTLLEKEKIKVDLELKNKELTSNVMYLLKKNEFISSVSEKLKLVIDHPDKDVNTSLDRIVTELDKNISDVNWEDFEVRFQEVYVGFYQKLSQKYPDLTPNDLRLCAFLRLNMTSKEIAELTFQSQESLKTARYRLRKKLGLDRTENLVAFFARF